MYRVTGTAAKKLRAVDLVLRLPGSRDILRLIKPVWPLFHYLQAGICVPIC